MYQIQTDLPIPTTKKLYRNSSEYPFFQMEIWHSFMLPESKKKSVATTAYEIKKVHWLVFKVKRLNEPVDWNEYWCRRVA